MDLKKFKPKDFLNLQKINYLLVSNWGLKPCNLIAAL